MRFIYLILFGLTLIGTVITSYGEAALAKDYIANSYYFKEIAIYNAYNLKPFTTHKVIIQSIPEKSNLSQKASGEKIFWTITGDQLSLINEKYIKYEVERCDEDGNDKPKYSAACYKSYILYGPEYLAFDEKSGIVYLSAPLVGGNAGWPIIIYAANIKTKEIKPLILEGGPVQAFLSPVGNYLALAGNYLVIINTQTGEEFGLKETHFIKKFGSQHIYIDYSDLKWMNNSTLQYKKTETFDKFFKEPPTYVVTKRLDIKTRATKIIDEKILN